MIKQDMVLSAQNKMNDHKKIRFQSTALIALQEACEAYMIGLLEDTK